MSGSIGKEDSASATMTDCRMGDVCMCVCDHRNTMHLLPIEVEHLEALKIPADGDESVGRFAYVFSVNVCTSSLGSL